MTLRRDPSKALQVGFLALLVVSIATVGWWMTDAVLTTRAFERRVETLYAADAQAVAAAYAGAPANELASLLPHLAIEGRSATVRPAAHAELAQQGAERVNRALWEGGFFLAVLLGGMAVLTRTIRHDAELRRRQQNFLAAVSHEFKSPLASIRLAAETLVLRSTEPDTKRLGARILEDGERLLRMVDNLLETTRLEEGRQRLHPSITSIEKVAAAVDRRGRRARAPAQDRDHARGAGRLEPFGGSERARDRAAQPARQRDQSVRRGQRPFNRRARPA